MVVKEENVLCAASTYEEKFYFNQRFQGLPESIKEELQIMCVLYTADIGGILTLIFDEEGNLISPNNKGNFIALDAELINHIQAIRDFVNTNKLSKIV